MLIPTLLTAQTDSLKNNCNGNTEVRDFQFSIFPFISINNPSDQSVVDVSLNLFGGYNKEVRKFEAGSILNMEGCNAGKCQLAGIGNIVGGESKGLQAAGIMNVVGSQNGCQIAGTVNVTRYNAGKCQLAGTANITGGSFKGLQAAGVVNACNNYDGAQLSGVLNFTKKDAGKCQIAGTVNIAGGSSQGLQAAGVINLSYDSKGAQISGVLNATFESTGSQIAGVANVTKEAQGAQIAGVANVAVNVKGAQISGAANVADSVDGAQISGCVNVARYVKGTQIGVINFADSVNGVPIGVISIVGNGYKKLELSFDELRFANFAFKTGVSRFYNIFSVGIRPGEFEKPLWTFGYGVGTKLNNEGNVSYDLELTGQHVAKGQVHSYESDIYKLYFGAEWKLTKGLAIAAGVTYNLYITDMDSPQYRSTYSSLTPYSFSESIYHNGCVVNHWLGGRIALRIL
jgi:hypothetical protein